jgi:hypothetical protein
MSASVNELARFTHKHNGAPLLSLSTPMPCPFCGKVAHVTIDWCGVGFRGDCYRCGATGPFGATPLEAARNWNSRPMVTTTRKGGAS